MKHQGKEGFTRDSQNKELKHHRMDADPYTRIDWGPLDDPIKMHLWPVWLMLGFAIALVIATGAKV